MNNVLNLSSILPVLVEWMGVIAIVLILGLSPAFKTRPLVFKYPRREGLVALALFLFLVAGLWLAFSQPVLIPPYVPGQSSLLKILSGLASGAGFLSANAAPVHYTPDDMLRQLTISALSMAPFVLALLIRGQPLLSTGLNEKSLRPSLTLGVALGFITIFLRGKIYSLIYSMGPAQINYLAAMAGVGLAEELIFRGYIQLRLSAWLGMRWGWIAASFAFALYHIPSRLLVEHVGLAALAPSLLMPLLFGLLQGWILQKTNNIAGLAIYHAIHNWMIILN